MIKKSLLFLLLMTLLAPWAVGQQALPYSYGFENNNLATDGWTSTGGAINSAAAYNSSSYGYRFSYSISSDVYLTSPILTGGTNGVNVSFYYKAYSGSYLDHFYVGYTTDQTVTDPSAFTYGTMVTSSTSWQLYEEALPAGTVRVAIKYDVDNYDDGYYLYLDDFSFTAASSCVAPTNALATYTSGTTATVTWDGSAASYNLNVNGTITSGVSSPYVLNVAPATTYTVKVQADCGSEQSAWVTAGTFTTDCPTSFSIPYTYGFEDEGGISCWTIEADNDGFTGVQNNTWAGTNLGGSYARTGEGFFFFLYTDTPPHYLISPLLSGISNGLHVEFWYRQYTNGVETFQVGYSTTDNDPSSFTWDAEVTASTTYQRYSANYPAGTKYVAVMLTSDDQYYLFLDDFVFEESASCLEPTAVTVTNQTTSGATVNWTAGGTETEWDIFVTDDATITPDDATTPTVASTSTKPYTLTGLTSATTYYVYVRAICAKPSAWSSPAIFNTECEGMVLPYSYDFQDDELPICWSTINTNTSYTAVGNMAPSSSSTNRVLYFYRGSSTGTLVAVLPEVDSHYSLSDYQITFDACYANGSGGSMTAGKLGIGIMDDPTDFTTFELIEEVDITDGFSTYGSHTVMFNNYTGHGQYIAIQDIHTQSGYVLVDNIEVTELPACIPPTNVAISGGANAVLTWDGSATSYQVAYSTDGTANPDDNIISTDVTATTFDLSTYVQAGDNYVWVRSNCGKDHSVWVDAYLDLNYCTPVPSSHDGSGITAVSFGTGSYVVTNGDGSSSLPATSPFYGDYTSMIGAVNAGVQSTISITTATGSYPYTFVIWVDLDNSYTFDDSEILYIGKASSGTGTLNATITVPATQALGDYRMRIYGADSYFTSFYGNGTTNWSAAHDPCSAGTYRHAHDYTLRVLEAPNCLAPSDLDANNITAHTAELSWTANSGETSWNIFYKKASDTDYTEVANVKENPYTLSGLNAGTDYVYYVEAKCSGTETSDPSSTFNFTTECEAFTITATNKYTQDFESPVVTSTYSSTTDLKLPSCWENPYTTGSTAAGKPHLIAKGSSYNYSSGQVLNFYGSGSNYVTLPEFTNDLQDLQISFKWATENSTNGTLTLGYITDGDVNYNTFTAITGASYPASASSSQTLIQADPVELSALPATAKRLVFRWVYNGQYSCNVDDLVVELIPSCKIPTGLTCTDYTATTATFDWTATGTNQTAWQLYISDKNIAPANDIAASEVINVTTKPYTVSTGLVAETTYYAWVRGNCTASSDGYSEWSEGIEFMPSQYKDFTYQETATSSTSFVPVYGSYVNNTTDKGQILIPASYFPEEMADATVRRLTFYTTSSYATADWSTAKFDVLVTEVEAASFATAAFFDWDAMTTVYSGSLSVSGNQMVIDLDTPFSYTGGNLVIGFNLTATGASTSVYWVANYGSTYYAAYQYGTSSVSRTYYQPKITFNYLPNPTPRPIDPHAVEELSTEATLAWTAPNSTEVTGYQYQYKLATATEWPTALTDGTGLTANITGLTPETTYDFRVRAVYPGPAYSQYAETQFTTTAACAIPDGLAAANLTMNTADLTWNASVEVANYTVEYRTAAGNNGNMLNEDFTGLTSGIPADWDNSEGTTTSASYKWSYYNNGHDAAPCLRFNSYMNSNNNTNFLKTPSMDFPAGKTMQLAFWWKNPTGGDFSVYISTDGGTTKTALKEGLTGQTDWKEETIDLTGYEGASNVTIHFKGTSNYGSGDAYIYLDEVIIGEVNTAGTWTAATTTAPNTGEYTIGGLTAGTKYDVRVYANCTTNPDGESTTTTITTLADGTMVFNNASGDGMWSTAANWSPSVPTITDNAILRADATITGAAAAKKITIEGTNTLTINDGGTLQTDNTVAATVKKHIDGYGSANTNTNVGYYLIANPMSSTVYYSSFATVGLTSGTYDLYRWSYSNDLEWSNYKDTQFSLATQTGYLYANESDVDLTFTGTVVANNTDVTKTLNYASTAYDFNGWNLVGNPFACNAYVKEGSSGVAYYRMNTAGNGFTAATGAIAPMEGIFVQATAASQSFKFTRTNPEANPGNGNLNISLAQTVTNRGEQGDTDNAIVRFNNGNTLEKFSFRGNTAKVYIPQDGKDYAVVNADAQGELPVYFKAYSNGNYTLSFTAQDVDFSYLHLIDNLTGNDVDLLTTPSYNFDARFTDYAARFKLVFCKGNANGEDNFGFISDGQLILTGLTGGETLQVIDALGRVITSTNAFNHISTDNMAPGVYVLRLINGNDVKTQKIVVR